MDSRFNDQHGHAGVDEFRFITGVRRLLYPILHYITTPFQSLFQQCYGCVGTWYLDIKVAFTGVTRWYLPVQI